MALNKDGHSTITSANGDITLITMQELERQKPDNEFTVIDIVVDKQ